MCNANWTDFINVGKHTKQIYLTDQLMDPSLKSSYVNVEIETKKYTSKEKSIQEVKKKQNDDNKNI